MDDNERKIRMNELMELKNQILNETKNINQDDEGKSNTGSKVKVKSNGKVTGIVEQPVNQNYHFFDKTGMVNILTLSVITFVFESLFLILSFIMFS